MRDPEKSSELEETAPPGLPSFQEIRRILEERVEGLRLEFIPNPAAPDQSSFCVPTEFALETARILRDDPRFALDFCSNVTGVDWLDQTVEETILHRETTDEGERTIKEIVRRRRPGFLEAVYHLYSMRARRGPLVIRQRTANRIDRVRVASLTPIWRSAEFQEREVYDLFGVRFEGHPDLRRILMWDEFKDYPMRKDYVEPDDYEYEPTPQGEAAAKARRHYPYGGAR
ncbi:MAG: NADH-quinone oxidoreductase subunit C [Verrucomicrobia bacterium]|nr:NADH-quinone oxidoreductase subunit C [Verrucomicrobiota bacterium]